jgi:hypothetical protein
MLHMVVGGSLGINEDLFNAQIDDLYHSLKNDILRSINIIDSIGYTKNICSKPINCTTGLPG